MVFRSIDGWESQTLRVLIVIRRWPTLHRSPAWPPVRLLSPLGARWSQRITQLWPPTDAGFEEPNRSRVSMFDARSRQRPEASRFLIAGTLPSSAWHAPPPPDTALLLRPRSLKRCTAELPCPGGGVAQPVAGRPPPLRGAGVSMRIDRAAFAPSHDLPLPGLSSIRGFVSIRSA